MTTTSSAASSSASILAALNGTSSSTSSTSETETRFLTLLTAQLKNQDPLNPQDSAEMTSQLAQISTVDGITKLNTTLSSLISSTSESQSIAATTMVGHQVLVPDSTLTMSSGASYGGVELDSKADSVTVTVKDSSGSVVYTKDLGAMDSGVNTFSWDGTTTAGETAADGTYSFSVAATLAGKSVASTALSLGTVYSVDLSSSGLSLNLGDAGAFSLSDVRKII